MNPSDRGQSINLFGFTNFHSLSDETVGSTELDFKLDN